MLSRTELVVHSQPECDELALLLALTDLRIVDHSAKQMDGCIRHIIQSFPSGHARKFNIPNTDAR